MSGCTRLVRLLTGWGWAIRCRHAIAPGGERAPVHDRGKVLVQAMLMLAGGGEACSDIERLRAQPTLFGAVPSDSTLYRTVRSLDAIDAWPACGRRWPRRVARCGVGRR